MSTKIAPSNNPQQWPRQAVNSVETRKRDLVVRISDWWRDRDEPAFDVEVYIGGVYDFHESESFTKAVGMKADGSKTGGYTKAQAKAKAIEFASQQIAKHL